ncbi:MAG: YigZ family protein [Clostridia bacterium]|nr:YigZ family protein [Clostridia bacterium]
MTKKIKRLKKPSNIEFIEKKSTFIGFSTFVKNEEEALEIIKQKKKEYQDATHNVYAYVIGENIARYSDDNEPQGTAGMPVLNAIRMSGISDVLVVVTRYFGGILLGAGGLVRAYSTAASMSLNSAETVVYEEYRVMEIVSSYSDYGKLSTMIAEYDAIIDINDFSDNVRIKFAIKEEIADDFIKSVIDSFNGRINPKFFEIRIDCK